MHAGETRIIGPSLNGCQATYERRRDGTDAETEWHRDPLLSPGLIPSRNLPDSIRALDRYGHPFGEIGG
jgi:hypothetical protein